MSANQEKSGLDLHPHERLDRLIPQKLDIIQSTEAFTFSIDALLLANFAKIRMKKRQVIVDFCSGNGVIPLLLSAKTEAPIQGLEIQADLADMARRSVVHNHLQQQIKILTADIKDAKRYFSKDSVDVITCNPPYFKRYDESRLNPNDRKAIARHEILMTQEDIFKQAKYILRGKGKLYMVHRPERLSELIVLGHRYQLTLKRLQFVYPKFGQPAKTILLEFMKNGQEKGLVIQPPFYTQTESDDYSEEAKKIIYGDEE
ncbi:tRNA1(Val) (adenine(37)-N6)-methyltransferase [Aerococcus kribbianus]|uniref:tRNA1(Val) (Adenine(37)-N6)-methyltransferase n=1 Tax=Aerococcus kribbianus TaxID=2999064 RepID=A0A9X3FT70_9LACT|nr:MULTISPECIES: tRNA1(Val) (adenine(37)-N6)-methyltransferase [unclassified Aerococcus]MCZ0717903.1 tRNA1(Val) (adenine(37)-N6)-methyltransferase [Aerococcus sp. YH-aer221]MCZ0726190.1 tRNA1(Val) (adenine(37)-N6)-methyltransferase [Aerococcus sp. YH-aer222]